MTLTKARAFAHYTEMAAMADATVALQDISEIAAVAIDNSDGAYFGPT